MYAKMIRALCALASLLAYIPSAQAAVYTDGPFLFQIGLSFDKFPDASWASTADLSNPCAWRYVGCDENSHVISVDLSHLALSGPLIDLIASLPSLQSLRLNNNNLSGPLPHSLGALSHLRLLDVSHNSFSGPIPPTLAHLLPTLTTFSVAFNNLSAPIPPPLHQAFCYPQFEGNTCATTDDQQTFPPCPKGGGYSAPSPPSPGSALGWGALTGIVLGAVSIPLFLTALCLCLAQRGGGGMGSHRLTESDPMVLLHTAHVKKFRLKEVKVATDNFHLRFFVGEGGSCAVFRGRMEGEGECAMKRMRRRGSRGKHLDSTAFLSELSLLSSVSHRCIVELKGVCWEGGERLLLFPLYPHGSVAKRFAGKRRAGEKPLSLVARRGIAADVASALLYLHSDCFPPIVHGDVKAANVFLGPNMEAALGDFGSATQGEESTWRQLRGTHGHVAPEVVSSGVASCASDMYAFGVFLLEIISGRDAEWLARQPKGGSGLSEWIRGCLQGGCLGRFVDIEIQMMMTGVGEGKGSGEGGDLLVTLTHLALLCVNPQPHLRPTAGDCLHVLEGEGALEEAWEVWGKDVNHDLMAGGGGEEEEDGEVEDGDDCKQIFAGLLSGTQDDWSDVSIPGRELAPR